MKKILSVLFVVFSFGAFAQAPAMLSLKGYGGNGADGIAKQVTKTIDGGFILCTGTNSMNGSGNLDTFSYCTTMGNYSSSFIKYNPDATAIEWIKCYDQNGDSAFGYIFPTADNGVVLGGQYNFASSTSGFIILKENAIGNIVWNRNYSKGNGAVLRDMIATSDGGYILAGNVVHTDTNFTVHGGSSLHADIGIIKLDSLGNKIWSKAIGGSDEESIWAVVEVSAGYCIVGRTGSNDYDCTGNHGDYDVYLAMLDRDGNILWHRDMGGTGSDAGVGVVADGTGGLLVAAYSSSLDGDVTHPSSSSGGYWLIDVDSSHQIEWDNCYGGGGGSCYPNSICKAIDGSIWIAGVSSHAGGGVDTAYGGEDAWIVHTESSGNFLNSKVLGSSLQDEAYMVYPLANGSVISGGYYFDSSGSFSSLNYFGSQDIFLTILSPWVTSIYSVQTAKNGMRLYPNPATNEVTIVNENTGNYALEIYNSIGSIIYKAVMTKNITFSVSGWPLGVYSVKVLTESDTQLLKLVVE